MARAGLEVAAANLDLRNWVRPGDRVLWGQGSAEPLTLIEALVAQRARPDAGEALPRRPRQLRPDSPRPCDEPCCCS